MDPSTEAPLYRVLDQTLLELSEELSRHIQSGIREIKLHFPRPLSPPPCFEGEPYLLGEETARYRSLRALLELAESLYCSLELTEIIGDWCEARLKTREGGIAGWHEGAAPSGHPEKYGMETTYARINKLEEPLIWRDLQLAFEKASVPAYGRVLSLGCNQGDELFALWNTLNREQKSAHLMGIDHSQSAVHRGHEKYPQLDLTVGDLTSFNLERYQELDLLMAINVLHSPTLEGHHLFKSWVKQLMKPKSSVLIGLPNCRYRGHELTYGAVTRHGGRSQDMAQLFSEAQFYMRYLRQQGFNVWVIGHYTLYIVGRRGPLQDDSTR